MSDWYMGQLADESRPFASAAFSPPPPAWPDPEPPRRALIGPSALAQGMANSPTLRNAGRHVIDSLRNDPWLYPSEPMGELARIPDTNPMQTGWARVGNAVRPISGEGRVEDESSRTNTTDPYTGAMNLALDAVMIKKPVRTAATALGGVLAATSDADAAPWSKVWSAISPYDAAKVAKSGKLEDYHRIANRKLERPLEDIPVEYSGRMPGAPTWSPADLEGKVLTPLVGDPTSAGRVIKSIDDIPLSQPLRTLGGHGYIRETGGYANAPEMASTIANRVKGLSQYFDTDQIIGAHTKMGPQSGDFSHHIWGTLSRQLPNAKLTRAAKADLNERVMGEIAAIAPTPAMKKAGEVYDWPKWPGVTSAGLEQHLAQQPDKYRKAFINALEKAAGEVENVPSVLSARYATTDPALLYAPTGASGMSMTRLTGGIRPSTHPDFPTHLEGDKAFSFGRPVPKEVIFPEIIERFDKQQPPDRWARKMYMPPEKYQHGQLATPRWVNDTSRYFEDVEQMGEVAALNKYVVERFGQKWK